MKKKIIILLILSFPTFFISQTLNVHKNDGTIYNVAIGEIDSITFTITTTCGNYVIYQGKTYNTVLIGSQCWFTKNIDVGTMLTVNSSEDDQTDNGIIEKYCYDNDIANCDTYGGLYQWNETMQYTTTEGAQGICPSGWHIATYEELDILYEYVGRDGNTLKATDQGSGDGVGSNTTGFSALLAGFTYWNTGNSSGLENYTRIWGSAESGDSGKYIQMKGTSDNITIGEYNKQYGFSVRCMKNE